MSIQHLAAAGAALLVGLASQVAVSTRAASIDSVCDEMAPPPAVFGPIAERRPSSFEYFVAPDGNDVGRGTRERPFRTIGRALSAELRPGDVVTVEPGEYVEVIYIHQSGDAEHDVIIRSEVRGGARIRSGPEDYSTVLIQANHVTFAGFDVQGGGGHAIEAHNVHNVSILDNHVHDSGGSGISAGYGEYFLIAGNLSRRNAATNGWHTSGISIYQARALVPERQAEPFSIVVRSNISCGNLESAAITDDHTDGNGIIIDDFQNTHGDSPFGIYPHRTLVENNLVFGNGGKGIQVTWSDNVLVRNNTAYGNNRDPLLSSGWRGELSNAQSTGNVWVNNIGVADIEADPRNTGIGSYSYKGYVNEVIWENNITFNGFPGDPAALGEGSPAPAAGANLLGVDPEFVAPEAGRFAPAEGSPAVDAGTGAYGVPGADLAGVARTGGVDIGALAASGP